MFKLIAHRVVVGPLLTEAFMISLLGSIAILAVHQKLKTFAEAMLVQTLIVSMERTKLHKQRLFCSRLVR